MRTPRRISIAAALLAAAATLTACSSDDDTEAAPETTESTTEAPATEDTETDAGPLTFGETFTWDDGLAVTATEPRPYSEEGYDGDFVAMDVTFENGTGSDYTFEYVEVYLDVNQEPVTRDVASGNLPQRLAAGESTTATYVFDAGTGTDYSATVMMNDDQRDIAAMFNN